MTIPINILVILCSDNELTEQLALAAAVGAVQARANIRIRRLPANDEERARGNEQLTRIALEYVPPTSADAVWADAVIVGLNDRIAGLAIGPSAATAYGRQVADDARAFKQRSK